MSEEEKTEKTEDKESDLISDNVALLKAKIFSYEKTIDELTEKLDEMTKKYGQARDFLEEQKKGELIEYLAPRLDYPKEFLVMKSHEELSALKQVVDKTVPHTFKSSAPLSYHRGPSARQKLDTKHTDYMKKLRRES